MSDTHLDQLHCCDVYKYYKRYMLEVKTDIRNQRENKLRGILPSQGHPIQLHTPLKGMLVMNVN